MIAGKWHVFLALVAASLTASCQSASSHQPPPIGIELSDDYWPVDCAYGNSDAEPIPLDFVLGSGLYDADRRVVETLEGAGYTVELFVISSYNTVPRLDWPPGAPTEARNYAYPGTAIHLSLGITEQRTNVAFGGVYVMCNTDPNTPDYIETLAQSLEAQIVREAFARPGSDPPAPPR